ncbi:hypothetical protein EV360DRAFT_89587 [Lentinula raphanica]|nr:hypothetical protein EV360DRAFT_89587 [Lentinula raphanica]
MPNQTNQTSNNVEFQQDASSRLPSSSLDPPSPGRVLEAISTGGSVNDSIHSPAPAHGKDTTSASGDGKDRAVDVNISSGQTPEVNQPRRSGRKTSAPTIIQPITSQVAPKTKRGRNVQATDSSQATGSTHPPVLEAVQQERSTHSADTVETVVKGQTKSNKGKRKGMTFVIYPLPLQSQSRARIASPPPPLSHDQAGPNTLSGARSGSDKGASDDEEQHGVQEYESAVEEEALQVLQAQKASLRRPVSPFDGAHSSDEEHTSNPAPVRRSLKEWKTLGRIPRYPPAEPSFPPPAKIHQDNDRLPSPTYIPPTLTRPRKPMPPVTPTTHGTQPPQPPNTREVPEKDNVPNPWGTVDGRAPGIYTTPASNEGRFPWVAGLDAELFGEGQDPEQVKEWLREAQENPNANLVLVWYADESHLSSTQRRAIAKHLISGRTNLPKEEVRTSPPNPVMRDDGTVYGAPKYDLLHGTTADAVANILSTDGQAVIAEGGKAIFLSAFPPLGDHFLALIEGLTFINNDEEAQDCIDFIRTSLANHSKIKQLIVSKSIPSTPPLPPNEIFNDWLNSLYLRPIVIGRSGPKPDPDAVEPEEPLRSYSIFFAPFTSHTPTWAEPTSKLSHTSAQSVEESTTLLAYAHSLSYLNGLGQRFSLSAKPMLNFETKLVEAALEEGDVLMAEEVAAGATRWTKFEGR